MNIVGLDLSLVRTGVCNDRGCHLIQPKTTGIARLHYIRTAVADLVPFPYSEAVVLVEGYSMGGQRGSSGVAQMLGEIGGIIRLYLWEHGIRYIDIPPAVLKKFATGKGNAGKDDMVACAARAGCPANDNNAVDAWWLYQMGLYHYDLAAVAPFVTAYRASASAVIDWPALETGHQLTLLAGRAKPDMAPAHLIAHWRDTVALCGAREKGENGPLPVVWGEAAQRHIDGHGMPICPACHAIWKPNRQETTTP